MNMFVESSFSVPLVISTAYMSKYSGKLRPFRQNFFYFHFIVRPNKLNDSLCSIQLSGN